MNRCSALVAVTMLAATAAFAADAPKAPAADQQAMMDKMMKAATPGPQHEMFKKMAGEWSTTVKFLVDPTQPMQESQGTSTITAVMDGRYCQEVATGQMMGQPVGLQVQFSIGK